LAALGVDDGFLVFGGCPLGVARHACPFTVSTKRRGIRASPVRDGKGGPSGPPCPSATILPSGRAATHGLRTVKVLGRNRGTARVRGLRREDRSPAASGITFGFREFIQVDADHCLTQPAGHTRDDSGIFVVPGGPDDGLGTLGRVTGL